MQEPKWKSYILQDSKSAIYTSVYAAELLHLQLIMQKKRYLIAVMMLELLTQILIFLK